MAELIGVQISELTAAPSLLNSTEFAVQRTGISKAEKVNLQNLSSYLINSTAFTNYTETSVNSRIQVHVGATDPHGDRAYSSNIVQAHSSSIDPHGDRAYSDNKINQSITTHSNAIDPHKDRLYTDTKITDHTTSLDPHGDRVYADTKSTEAVLTSKNYTDSSIQTKVTDKLGVTIATLVNNKVPEANIEQHLLFSSRASFPLTGVTNVLYIDNTNNDIYRWSGSAYINLTPEADISSLTLTTNNVAEGTNEDRKYLTANLKTSYDNKISGVKNSSDTESNKLVEKTENKEVFIKNLVSDSNISLVNNLKNISITDNVYKYTGTTTDTELSLVYTTGIKSDILKSIDKTRTYNINGEVNCLEYDNINGVTYIVDSEKILIDSFIGNKAVLESLQKPTSVIINSSGNIVSGTSVANKQTKVYDKNYVEIGVANVLPDNTFNISLTTPIINGTPLYVATIDGTSRSELVKIYSPNLGTNKVVSNISVTSDGLSLSGNTEKNSTITILSSTDVILDTGTSDINGNFTITMTNALVSNSGIKIKVVNAFNIESITNYSVILATLIPVTDVILNNDRTLIKGKAEPNATITILNTSTPIGTVVVPSSGVFEAQVSIPTSLTTIGLFIVLDTKNYNTSYTLDTYINETNKLGEIRKIISSSFDTLFLNQNKLNNKTKYLFSIDTTGSDVILKVTNNTNKTTKWIANLKIIKTQL